LLEHAEAIQKEVFWSTASLLNLTVDLIFFDTTNTYFEIHEPGPSELKAYGKSKDKRDDLPLVTVGLAVTREGLPVRCWMLPGNQHDSQSVAQVQQDLNNGKLGRAVGVMDRGMTSNENRRILQKAGGQYILGEKLRGNHMGEMALSQLGRFKLGCRQAACQTGLCWRRHRAQALCDRLKSPAGRSGPDHPREEPGAAALRA
jgi:hypothetical protein